MQSDLTMDFTIKNPFGETNTNNAFTFFAEDNWNFLKDVYEKKIPMFSQAYSILANTMEQFYKGIYVELKRIHPEIPEAPEYELKGHRFDVFVSKINKIIPVSRSKEGYFTILDNCSRIYLGYTNAKYRNYYEYEDFCKDFRRYEVQRERLYKALDNERQKYEAKEVMSADENNREDDLDLYR